MKLKPTPEEMKRLINDHLLEIDDEYSPAGAEELKKRLEARLKKRVARSTGHVKGTGKKESSRTVTEDDDEDEDHEPSRTLSVTTRPAITSWFEPTAFMTKKIVIDPIATPGIMAAVGSFLRTCPSDDVWSFLYSQLLDST